MKSSKPFPQTIFDIKRQERRMLLVEQDYWLIHLNHAMNENDIKTADTAKERLFSIHDELKRIEKYFPPHLKKNENTN